MQFLVELTLHMSKTRGYEMHYRDLKKMIIKSMLDRLFIYYSLENFDQKIRTCTFLCRDSEGNYSFIHKSFMEYFVALGVREAFETTRDLEQIQKVLAGVEFKETVWQFLMNRKFECPSCKPIVDFSKGQTECEFCSERIKRKRL